MMRYVYESCKLCGTEPKQVDLQVYRCQNCSKFYKRSISEASERKGRELNRAVFYTYVTIGALVLLAVYLPLLSAHRRSSVLIILGVGISFLFYKINKLNFNPKNDPVIEEINLSEFSGELKRYLRDDLSVMVFTITLCGVMAFLGIYFDLIILSLILSPLIFLLAIFPIIRILRINRELKLLLRR